MRASPLILALVGALVATPLLVAAPARADSLSDPATSAQDQTDAQRRLTEKDVANFLAASQTVEPILARQPEDAQGEPDAAALAELDEAAKRAGLKDYADYDELAANIGFVLQGFDPEKKAFVGHKAMIRAEIVRVAADASMSKRDKAEAVRDLKAELAEASDVQFPENIALVAPHYDELSAALKP